MNSKLNSKLINEKALKEQLNSLVQLANELYFFFFSWGFYYWNAGTLTYKKIYGNFQTWYHVIKI